MANRLDIAKYKAESGLLSSKGADTSLADGLSKLFSGIKADVDAKSETRQKFKEEGATDIRDLRSLRDQAEADGATASKSSSGGKTTLGAVPSSTTLANWTLSQLDTFIQDSYDQQEIVTSGMGGKFAVRDYGIFKSNQKQTWAAVKGRVDNAQAELDETIKRNEGWTDKDGTVHQPIAGGGEAAMQQYQSFVSDLANTTIKSGSDGMGIVNVYKTEYNPATGLQVRVLEDGKPVINENISGTSVMGLLNKENSRWNKTDVNGTINKAFSKELIASYEVVVGQSGYQGGSTEDNIRRNPSFTQYTDTFINKNLPNNKAVSSTLTDNFNGQFIQLDPNQTENKTYNGETIDLKETVSVNILTGYDKSGKPIYKNVDAPKYVGMKVTKPGGQLIVDTTEAHKTAASGIYRAAIDGKIGKSFKGGIATAQYDPYRASKKKVKDEENVNKDIFGSVTKGYGGTAAEIRQANETLIQGSNYKFTGGTGQKEVKNDRTGEKVVTELTYRVDKGDGGGIKSIPLTLNFPNPDYKLSEQKIGDKWIPEFGRNNAGKLVKNPEFQPQFIESTRKEYEDNKFKIFGKGSVADARSEYSKDNPSYDVNDNKMTNTAGTSANTVDISTSQMKTETSSELGSVSSSTKVGDKTAINNILSSQAITNIKSNWKNGGIKNTTNQLIGVQSEIQSQFDALNALQNGNQGNDVKIKYTASTGEFYAEGPNGEKTDPVSFAVADKYLTGAVKKVMDDAISKFLPGRAETTTKKRVDCVNGFKVIGGVTTKQVC